LCGNPKGKPVFIIHGGPGAGSSPYWRRFFNPEKFLIVLHDQRGCGKSKPKAELRENTSQFLVEDIEQLRRELDLEKIILFGGSWGSTLSLAYAETYPENVSGLVLRGIFLGSKEEINNIMFNVIPKFFPESNEALVKAFPENSSFLNVDSRLKLLQSLLQSEDLLIREKYIKLWSRYESKASGLHIRDELLNEFYKSENNLNHIHSMALLEMHYLINSCFFEEDQLLSEANKIQHIQTTIVNGRYDIICPPYTAYKLHNKLSDSKLILVEKAGHSMDEQPIETELLKAMLDYE